MLLLLPLEGCAPLTAIDGTARKEIYRMLKRVWISLHIMKKADRRQ